VLWSHTQAIWSTWGKSMKNDNLIYVGPDRSTISDQCLCCPSLRTLEFWVDNLNPEFLFPELSKQNQLFVQLMKALSMHLRPAPYPYGLLTLRLLGKLGGKNRKVLREPIDICDPTSFKEYAQRLGVECSWAVAENSNATVANMETSDKSIDVGRGEPIIHAPVAS
jgi:hypothetical protein